MPNMSPNVQKNAQDWVRDLRFSNQVNMQTMGVDTDRVTPQLLLASSNKLLSISKGQQEGDAKDSLQFQRFYGPVEYFAERIQKDGGSVARSMLWKATNRGSVDFIGPGSLEPHVNAVFHESNLSRFVDNSSVMEGIDTSQLVTRIGEGGVNDEDSVPIEMRLVQPSYYGYVDPVRTQQKNPGVTAFMTKNVMKGTDGKLYQNFINMHTGQPELVDSQKAARSIVTTDEYLDGSDSYVYALGGPKGLRVVKRSDVDYILPNSDDAYSMSSTVVPMLSGIKAMRLLMGCHHPETPITVIDSNGMTHIVPAKRLASMENIFVFGCNENGVDCIYPVRKVVTRVPAKKAKFKKIVLSSGRTLLTSAEHKWWIYDKQFRLLQAKELKEGMKVPRSMFSTMPVIRTSILGAPVTPQICTFMGRIIRSLKASNYSYRVTFIRDKESGVDQKKDIEAAIQQLNIQNYNIFSSRGMHAVSIKDPVFQDWIDNNIGKAPEDRRIPSELLSLPTGYTSVFLDSYYKDLEEVGENLEGDIWLLNIANPSLRDQLSFMLSKLYTDTIYRDFTKKGKISRALQLVPVSDTLNDIVLETITKILDVPAPAVMIDVDCDDHVYAAANGVITHNSKYVSQAVPLQEREAPLVRGLDQATGMDMATKVGKLLGTQWAPKAGMVKAVREDRIDMVYDDGTTGSVYLYKDLPANAKGWLTNYPKVKAGDKVTEGQLLASSNYTDDNGLLGVGRNLRIGYLSYKGGTYEDGCTLSQTGAKKLGYTTMYKTDMDKDKSIRTAKHLYVTWKPGQYTKEQLDNIDDEGVVKVGATVNKGDPVILGIRTTEPSPGTLGKRILSDVTEVWEHAHPGVITDVVNGKNGIKVYAKVSAPLEAGDKMCYDKDTEVLTDHGWKFFKDVTKEDKVYTLDPSTDSIVLQKPILLEKYQHTGKMYKLVTPQVDLLVTPNHKNLVDITSTRHKYVDNAFELVEVDKLFGKMARYKKNGTWKGEEGVFAIPGYTEPCGQGGHGIKEVPPMHLETKTFFKFLGFYLADGCAIITKKRDFIVQLSKKTPEKNLKIEELLNETGFKWYSAEKTYLVRSKQLVLFLKPLGKALNKYIPNEVFSYDRESLQALFDGMMLGDGHYLSGRPISYTTISKQLADDFSRLCLLVGKAGNIKLGEDPGPEGKPAGYRKEGVPIINRHRRYNVQIVNSKLYPSVHFNGKPSEKNHIEEWADYDDYVYCCTVPEYHTLYVRRDGKPVWSGNSNLYGGKGTIAKVLPDSEMPKDSKGRPLELLYDPLGIVSRCYDAETQFLTKRGWKKGAEVTDKDQLWSFDPKTWECSWSKQLEPLYKKHYSGHMYGYEGKLANFLVTPGHKVWARTRKSDWEQQQIQDIYNQESYIPVIADPQTEPKATPFKLPVVKVRKHDTTTKNELIEFAPEDFASFLGWYLSQGHYSIDDHGYNTYISQDGDIYPDKCWKIHQLLKRMNLSYSYSNSSKRFRIYGKRLAKYVQQFGKCDQKFIPNWLFKQPSYVKQCFVDALLMGDGKVFTKHKDGKDYTTSAICLTSQILIDQLQALLATMGVSSTKHYDGPDKRYPDSKPMWRLGITTTHRQVRSLREGWYQKYYDGTVYCPTVKTGYVLTRRNGCLACLGNTNPSQLMEVGLGKVAEKIGQPIVVPAFQPKGQSRLQFVKDMMKKYNVPWKEDCTDPETGRTIKNVYTGVCYFIPLKHIADTKMSARGTAKYSADEVPLGGGEEGCFPAIQGIITEEGEMSIGEICKKKLPVKVLSWDKESKSWVYKKVVDWFIRKCEPQHMLYIVLKDMEGHQVRIFPTDNHMMYLYKGDKVEAGKLKVGDLLQGFQKDGFQPMEVVYIERGQKLEGFNTIDEVFDITVEDTHNYTLTGGVNVSNSKRLGSLQVASLVGHNAFNFLQEAKLIRGQANSDFWRSLRTGQIPVMPGEPLAHKKFFAHLQASGLNIQRNQEGVKIFALSNKDVNELAGPRELKSTDTYQQKSFQPIDGGLFGQDVFGPNGDKWGYIQLDSPLPNPVMEEPLARLLNVSDRQFQAIAAGKGTVKGMKDAGDMKRVLSKMDLQKEADRALLQMKQSSKSNKDKALKRYVAIARMRDQGVRPQEYMLDRIPVLPPKFRPITSHGDLTMVADSNYLYSQLLNARDDLREAAAAGLPQEYQQQGKANLYSKWKELVGLYDPSDVKLRAKNVKGLLKWAMGKSPKVSALQQKVLGSTVDTVGRGVIIPSTKIKLNQIGMPVEMAWKLYAPFVTRKLTQQGYSPVDAMQLIKEHKPVAMEALLEEVKARPVVMNRAPSLHKLSLMGFNVKLTNGHAIKVNPSIVVPYNADFDGDSIWNTVWTVIDREEAKGVFDDFSKKGDLTNQETGCILSKKAPKVGCQLTERLDNMFGKETSARLLQCNMALSEIPHKEGTEVQKSETVTEWEPGINVYLPTIDPATGEMTIGKMTKISRHTGLKMFDCTLSVSGAYSHVVTASEDHSLITLNPSTLELEKTRPEDAKGRCVPRVFGTYANHWEHCAKYIQLDKQYPLSYEMGVFLGTMIGDGWVDSNGYSFIACCDKSFQDYIIKNFAPSASMPFTKEAKLYRYAADEQRFSQDDKQRFSIYMDHKAHWALKEKIGSGAYNKKIPWECLLASKAHMIGILVGLLATDGHVGLSKTASKKAAIKNIAYHTTSGLLRDGIQELCMRLGVKTRVTPYMGVNSKVTCYSIGFCLEDIAKLKREHADLFVLPVEHKEEALKTICADIEKGVQTSYDVVPFPRGLFCEFSWAKVADVAQATVVPARKKGYIKRDIALKIAEKLEGCQWQYYETPPYLKKEDRTNHTPEEAKALVDKWISIVRNDEIGWEIVDDVTPSTCTEGWDCTVPGPYTFALSTGTIVQDTVNIHVPVSKKAVEDVRQKMMPERNLIGIRDYKVLYKPEKAYVQGLYVATRMGETKDVKVFPSQAEATKAYKRGQIDIDTPIVIKEKQS